MSARLPRHLTNLSPDAVVHTREIAQLLGCSEKTAETHMASGDLPATKLGRGWVTTYDQVVQFIRGRLKQRPAVAASAPAPGADVRGVIVKPSGRGGRRTPPDLRPLLAAADGVRQEQ